MLNTKTTTEELEDKLADMGITVDPDLELNGGMDKDELIDCYKDVLGALKLLLISENLDEAKLRQAIDLSRGFK